MAKTENTADKRMRLNRVISELALETYLRGDTAKHKQEKRKLSRKIRAALQSMIMEPNNTLEHTKCTVEFIEALWEKYDCREVADFFRSFAKIEPALLSLGEARDHFVHTFHVFVFGLRMISQMISKLDERAEQAFKIRNESEETCVFPYAYNFKERIFYVWTLASTFHDIGYPLEHLPEIEQGIERFTDYCKLKITPLFFQPDYPDISELNGYLKLISTLYGGKLTLEQTEQNVWTYEKKEHPYFHKVLISALRERNHGVISCLILLRVIEDVFLFASQQKTKYELTPDQFNMYNKYVYNEDIARAGLIISLHHLKSEALPHIEKIKFSEYPLSFLLVLADEFQHFLRRTETLGQEKIILRKIPNVSIQTQDNITTTLIEYELDDSEIAEIQRFTKLDDPIAAVKKFWSSSTKILDERLASEDNYKVHLKVRKSRKIIYDWELQ